MIVVGAPGSVTDINIVELFSAGQQQRWMESASAPPYVIKNLRHDYQPQENATVPKDTMWFVLQLKRIRRPWSLEGSDKWDGMLHENRGSDLCRVWTLGE